MGNYNSAKRGVGLSNYDYLYRPMYNYGHDMQHYSARYNPYETSTYNYPYQNTNDFETYRTPSYFYNTPGRFRTPLTSTPMGFRHELGPNGLLYYSNTYPPGFDPFTRLNVLGPKVRVIFMPNEIFDPLQRLLSINPPWNQNRFPFGIRNEQIIPYLFGSSIGFPPPGGNCWSMTLPISSILGSQIPCPIPCPPPMIQPVPSSICGSYPCMMPSPLPPIAPALCPPMIPPIPCPPILPPQPPIFPPMLPSSVISPMPPPCPPIVPPAPCIPPLIPCPPVRPPLPVGLLPQPYPPPLPPVPIVPPMIPNQPCILPMSTFNQQAQIVCVPNTAIQPINPMPYLGSTQGLMQYGGGWNNCCPCPGFGLSPVQDWNSMCPIPPMGSCGFGQLPYINNSFNQIGIPLSGLSGYGGCSQFPYSTIGQSPFSQCCTPCLNGFGNSMFGGLNQYGSGQYSQSPFCCGQQPFTNFNPCGFYPNSLMQQQLFNGYSQPSIFGPFPPQSFNCCPSGYPSFMNGLSSYIDPCSSGLVQPIYNYPFGDINRYGPYSRGTGRARMICCIFPQ